MFIIMMFFYRTQKIKISNQMHVKLIINRNAKYTACHAAEFNISLQIYMEFITKSINALF